MDASEFFPKALGEIGRSRIVYREVSGGYFGDDHIVGVPCFCVQDTPDNPCPCPSWPWVLIPRRSVLDSGGSDRSTSDGEGLSWVEVDASTSAILLAPTEVAAGDLVAAGMREPGSAAMRRSRLDDWLRYQKEFWYYVTVGAWGPLPTQPPEPPS